jgi:phosphate acyltransferase
VEDKVTIAVDAMGADLGCAEVVAGVKLALSVRRCGLRVALTGQPAEIEPQLRAQRLDRHPDLVVVPAAEVIGMHEKPVQSLRQKKDASLVRVVEQVKAGTAAAAVSCGNTGALMACSTLKLRPVDGVAKPALSSVWPRKDGHFVVLDVGANPLCRPEHLVHYAVLGSLYAQTALGMERPRVGLLTIGTEEGKGTELTAQTHEYLKKLGDQIHYCGLVEGFQLFRNDVDVVVTDGFTGNVVLKSCESMYKMLKGLVKEEATRNPVRLMGALMFSGALKSVRKRLDPDRYGGAPLLGLRGMVIKAHGSSSRHAIANAIAIAAKVARQDFRHQTEGAIALANQTMRIDPAAIENPPSVSA